MSIRDYFKYEGDFFPVDQLKIPVAMAGICNGLVAIPVVIWHLIPGEPLGVRGVPMRDLMPHLFVVSVIFDLGLLIFMIQALYTMIAGRDKIRRVTDRQRVAPNKEEVHYTERVVASPEIARLRGAQRFGYGIVVLAVKWVPCWIVFNFGR